jgi:hypothetical protein
MVVLRFLLVQRGVEDKSEEEEQTGQDPCEDDSNPLHITIESHFQ